MARFLRVGELSVQEMRRGVASSNHINLKQAIRLQKRRLQEIFTRPRSFTNTEAEVVTTEGQKTLTACSLQQPVQFAYYVFPENYP